MEWKMINYTDDMLILVRLFFRRYQNNAAGEMVFHFAVVTFFVVSKKLL